MREFIRDRERADLCLDGLCSVVTAAVIGTVGVIGGASIASKGAQKAANAQVGAATAANDTQLNIFNQQRADQEPWRQAGMGALDRLNGASQPGGDMSFLQNSPGYQFGMNQGINALNSRAATSGLLNSGANLKNITQFGQDYAGTKFDNYWNQQAGLAGVGQAATNQLGQAGQNYANQFGQNALMAGNARAGAYQQQGQNQQNLIGGLAGVANSYLANRQPVNPMAWSPTSYASQGQGYSSGGYLNGLF